MTVVLPTLPHNLEQCHATVQEHVIIAIVEKACAPRVLVPMTPVSSS
ncbi:hypothetical protein [Poseidonocella sp. HB161398]|nr:hypothetical protein [Poseidonocella sp. HB161398]